ncbi:MAG TPA: hypothetical protein VIK51_00940 [Vicinamibacteria bacterium]
MAARAASAVLVLAPLLAGRLAVTGPRTVTLNFGPGDGPYLSGFAPEYEIDDKVGTHWTTYHAGVALPLQVRGGPIDMSYRFTRGFGETAQVEILFDARAVDHFQCRGGTVLERKTALGALPPTRVRIGIESDSHERRDRGLKMDWIRLVLGPGARLRLIGWAAVMPTLAVALVLAIHLLAGWSLRHAVVLTAPWSLAAVAGLVLDPWLTHRLLRGIPLALTLFGGVGLAAAAWRRRRGALSAESLRVLAALALAAFLLRALAVNHPDFYYPDLRTHARLVEKVQEGGASFFVSPSRAIWEHGVWRTEAYGKTYAFPYTPGFHLPFTLLKVGYDTLLLCLKLSAAAISVVPIFLTWALARRLGVSVLGAALLAVIPTYTSRLSFAFLPALFGHAFDLALVCWLATHLDSIRVPRTWLVGAGWIAACQLAYISGVMNTAALVLALVLWALARRRPAEAVALAAMGLGASVIAVALFYRDFLGMVFDLVPRIAQGAAQAPSRYPVQPFWLVAYERTRDFFDTVYPILAAAGLALMWREAEPEGAASTAARRWLLVGWLGAYLLLLAGRAKAPDVFLHGHETLLVTPLVCLAAGVAVACLARLSRAAWWTAVALLAALAAQGALGQWRAIAEQLGNAR